MAQVAFDVVGSVWGLNSKWAAAALGSFMLSSAVEGFILEERGLLGRPAAAVVVVVVRAVVSFSPEPLDPNPHCTNLG